MRRGEIRHVRSWPHVGHEATGNRPCLIISPDWFNANGNAIIAPLTTPGSNHEHWWEIPITSTYSTCLVPDVRTVPGVALGSTLLGNATQYELDDAVFALYRLIGGLEDGPDPGCDRGEVWTADLSGTPSVSPREMVELLVLHYNPANLMAMTAMVTRRPRGRSPLVFPLSQSSGHAELSALLSQLRGISAASRLEKLVGATSPSEMAEITAQLTAFLS